MTVEVGNPRRETSLQEISPDGRKLQELNQEMRFSFIFVCLFSLSAVTAVQAETVTIKGTHLCCGGCRDGAEEALSDVDGVAEINCDLNTKVIAFEAASVKAAQAGIAALAKAGFYGQAAFGKQPLKFPASGVKKSTKSNSFVLGGLHLCCKSCVTGSQKALANVKGVSVIDIDRNEKTIKLTGDGIHVLEAIAALNKAGFACQLPKSKRNGSQ